ncbi:MAG TPA: hypothetical protein PKC75_19220 [Dysgonomonas sp.]|nr:hypothetical protein [Dysgonomonas sp.]
MDADVARLLRATCPAVTIFLSGISRVTRRILKNGLDEILPESLIFRKMKV